MWGGKETGKEKMQVGKNENSAQTINNQELSALRFKQAVPTKSTQQSASLRRASMGNLRNLCCGNTVANSVL